MTVIDIAPGMTCKSYVAFVCGQALLCYDHRSENLSQYLYINIYKQNKTQNNNNFTPLYHIPEDSDLCTDCYENLKISYES